MNLGFVAIGRPTFDVDFAEETSRTALAGLRATGHQVMGDPVVAMDASHVESAVVGLPADLDGLVVFQATFADSTLVEQVARLHQAPLLLWAVPEARTGGRLRLNSLCGVNLAGYALTAAGRTYEWMYRAASDPHLGMHLEAALTRRVEDLLLPDLPPASPARVESTIHLLRSATVGVLGDHPNGFSPCAFDASALADRLGLRVDPVPLDTLFSEASATPDHIIDTLEREAVATLDGAGTLDREPLRRTLALHTGLDDLAARRGWSALATRCWPECFTEFGAAACAAQARMSEAGIPGCCEADAHGSITALVLQHLTGEPAFVADLVDLDRSDGTAVMWHCGVAPRTMADPRGTVGATIHSNRKLPLLHEFALKPGRVTMARLGMGPEGLRLAVGGGTMLARPRPFGGTAGVLTPDAGVDALLDAVMAHGLDHHYGIGYGDVRAELVAWAHETGMPLVWLG